MQICLNQRQQEFPTEGLHSFGDLMKYVAKKAEREGARVLRVKLNGQDITGKDRTGLEAIPLDQVRDLEIQIGDPKVLAQSTLFSVAEFL